ncbi:MarR family winged helix-turn-helix transcriptional regulator [Amycolatopsis sp. CA-230715]|uniref:MarR family winged helix-turn-helix transcriptional regulator n=1 Tax=Amycolatopsis sp. CA-230715 TaxID=2745196 RepID=UPI001C0247D3|nr:MarR family transcriptional regulator [Amycolatopsis sp. CA-230715]QWF81545.1 putative HTH-type transcriptional regulator [Amycolatopsis sp. CA-230715]
MGAREETAVRLAVAVKRLRSRIRVESGVPATGLSISQLSVLTRIRDHTETTAAALAVAEHVSQQAIAQSLATLKSAGYVRAEPDPEDRRKSLLAATPAGERLIDSINASRDVWLARAIDSAVRPGERAALDKAIDLLERLADAETR